MHSRWVVLIYHHITSLILILDHESVPNIGKTGFILQWLLLIILLLHHYIVLCLILLLVNFIAI